MKHFTLSSLLLSATYFGPADKPGGGSSPADDARAKAQAAKDAQAQAEADKAAKAAQEAAGGPEAPEGNAVDQGLAPPVDVEGLDPKALLARLDAQDRLIKSLQAGMAGNTGPAVNEAKDTQVAASGAALDPRLVRQLPPGVSSTPALQPMPSGSMGSGGVTAIGGAGLWGETSKGGPVQARAYPGLDEEDVMVTSIGYHDDAIRNVGDIIRGYTGPAASWFVPTALVKDLGNMEEAAREWRKKLGEFAARAAA